MKKKLTNKELRFCEEYVVDFNGTRAATVAGYSKKSASTIAFRLLRKVEIVERIADLTKELTRITGINAVAAWEKIALIAYSDITDVLDITPAVSKVGTDGEILTIPASVSFKDKMSKRGRAAVRGFSFKNTQFGCEVRVQLNDSLAALAMITKQAEMMNPTIMGGGITGSGSALTDGTIGGGSGSDPDEIVIIKHILNSAEDKENLKKAIIEKKKQNG